MECGRGDVDVDRLILVCGVGRSGTSLIQSMLNAHPKISFPPETHFFRRYLPNRSRADALARRGPLRFRKLIEKDQYYRRLGMDVGELLNPYVRGERDFSPGDVYRRMLCLYASKAGAERVGDKDPKAVDYIRALALTFPSAYIVHIVRDPRDVLASRMKAAWSSRWPWWLHVLVYAIQISRGKDDGRQLFRDRYMEVKYEDLIANPVETLTTVCKHIGIEFDMGMLAFGRSAGQLVAEEEMQWKKETLGPLLTENKGKWHKVLSPRQIFFTEIVCSNVFDEFGYRRVRATGERVGAYGVTRMLAVSMLKIFGLLYRLRQSFMEALVYGA